MNRNTPLGTKVFNKRLGKTGKIVSYCDEPSFEIEDEDGHSWSGAMNSLFCNEWIVEKDEIIRCGECGDVLISDEEKDFGQCDKCCAWKYRDCSK
jgi:hypothetical protein